MQKISDLEKLAGWWLKHDGQLAITTSLVTIHHCQLSVSSFCAASLSITLTLFDINSFLYDMDRQ